MSGYIAISRDIWDHPDLAGDEPFTKREAFMWLIAEASWKERRVRRGRTVVDLERGQLAHSVRFIASAWGWSKSAGHRFLKNLEKRDMVRTVSGTDATIITICNYDKYQGTPGDAGTLVGHQPGHWRDTGGTNENQDNQDNQVKPKREGTARKRASRLPEDWTCPADFIEYGMKQGLTRQRAEALAEEMHTWSLTKPNGTSLDWKRTYQAWARKAAKNGDTGHEPAHHTSRPAGFPDRGRAASEQRKAAWISSLAKLDSGFARDGGSERSAGDPPSGAGSARIIEARSARGGGRFD